MNDGQAITSFFSLLFDGVESNLYTTVMGINSSLRNSPPVFNKHFQVGSLPALVDFVMEQRDVPHMHLYFRASYLAEPPQNGSRGKEKDTVGTNLLWVDLDVYNKNKTPSDALETLEHFLHPPTITIFTGRGVQAFWKIDEFCTTLSTIRNANRWLQDQFFDCGSDHVGDLARVMRIPYTFNHKSHPATLSTIEATHTERVYPISQFTLYSQPPPPRITQTILYPPVDLPDTFLDDVRSKNSVTRRLMVEEEEAKRAGAPLKVGGVVDLSRNDFRIATSLLNIGYSEAEVCTALRHPTWLCGKKYRDTGREEYVTTTVRKANTRRNDGPDRYFEARRFIPERLFDAIVDDGASFILTASTLWFYDEGVYRAQGEDFIRHEASVRLGERWRSEHANETVAIAKAALFPEFLEEQRTVAPPVLLDANQLWISTYTGLINVGTKERRIATPEDRIFSQLPVVYDSTASTSELEEFVAQILPPDCIPVWWEWVGYNLLPDTRFRRALLIVGEIQSGKSTLLNLLERFLGLMNTCSITLQSICDEKFSGANLFGKLANIYSDLDMVEVKHAGTFKIYVSGERLMGEEKFKKAFAFYPSAKHSYSANAFLPVSDPDDGYASRWLVMRTPNQFFYGASVPEHGRANVKLIDKLSTKANLSAMLNLALEGLNRLLSQGQFSDSLSMKAVHNEFLASIDSVVAFLQDMTVSDETAHMTKKALWLAYQDWCHQASGRFPVQNQKFYQRMKSRLRSLHMTEGMKTIEGIEQKCYFGVRLKKSVIPQMPVVYLKQDAGKAFRVQKAPENVQNYVPPKRRW